MPKVAAHVALIMGRLPPAGKMCHCNAVLTNTNPYVDVIGEFVNKVDNGAVMCLVLRTK